MENLKMPVRRVLLNSIDYTKVGAYYDTVKAVNVLSFKEYGINIPYVSTAFHGAKTCYDAGAVQSLEIELANACPCSDCNWQYGVTIVKKVQLPEVGNNESNYNRKSYSGVIPTITCTAGLMDDKWLLEAEDDIITQIYNDQGLHNNNTDPVTGGGAVVKAVRSYKITTGLAATYRVNFTLTSTGATTTIVLNTGATVITQCLDLNADATFAAHARAVAVNATEIAIFGLTGNDLFTIADGAGAATITVDYRRVWFTGLDPQVKFAVQYDLGFATTYKKYLFAFNGAASTASVTAGKTIWINGVAHNLPDLATTTLEVAAINAVTLAHEVYATNIGNVNDGNIWIYGSNAVTSLNVTLSPSPATNPTVYIDPTYLVPLADWYNCTAGGSYPILTGKEVSNLLANAADEGTLSKWSAGEKPDPTAKYCLYFLQTDSSIYAIHGASHMDNYRCVVEVFIKKSLIDDHFLYPANNAAAISGQASSLNAAPTTTATMDFEQLLQAWAGTGTIAQATGIVTGGSNPNTWTN